MPIMLGKYLHRNFFSLVLMTLSVAWIGCNRTASIPMSLDTLHPSPDTFGMKPPAVETTKVTADTGQLALPRITRAVDPGQLAAFLPPMVGWTPQGELQKELSVRDSMNLSRVWQTYIMGADTAIVEINDYAYVPSLYAPYQKYMGTYLEDNNTERVETTAVSGFRAVQTMEKKVPHAQMVIFPGNRYVVVISENGTNDVNDLRRIGESLNLRGLAALQ